MKTNEEVLEAITNGTISEVGRDPSLHYGLVEYLESWKSGVKLKLILEGSRVSPRYIFWRVTESKTLLNPVGKEEKEELTHIANCVTRSSLTEESSMEDYKVVFHQAAKFVFSAYKKKKSLGRMIASLED